MLTEKNKNLLNETVEDSLSEALDQDVLSEEHKQAIKDAMGLLDRGIEIEKITLNNEEQRKANELAERRLKLEERKLDLEIEQSKAHNRERVVDWIIDGVKIISPFALLGLGFLSKKYFVDVVRTHQEENIDVGVDKYIMDGVVRDVTK